MRMINMNLAEKILKGETLTKERLLKIYENLRVVYVRRTVVIAVNLEI